MTKVTSDTVLSIREFDPSLKYHLKVACAKSDVSLRDWCIKALQDSLVEHIVELPTEVAPNLDERIRAIVREELESHHPVTSVTLPEPEVIRPSMEALRDICAGITPTMQPLREALDAMRPPLPGPPMSQMPCHYKEYDEQTGETYACGLSAHSAKVKHTRGRRL